MTELILFDQLTTALLRTHSKHESLYVPVTQESEDNYIISTLPFHPFRLKPTNCYLLCFFKTKTLKRSRQASKGTVQLLTLFTCPLNTMRCVWQPALSHHGQPGWPRYKDYYLLQTLTHTGLSLKRMAVDMSCNTTLQPHQYQPWQAGPPLNTPIKSQYPLSACLILSLFSGPAFLPFQFQ